MAKWQMSMYRSACVGPTDMEKISVSLPPLQKVNGTMIGGIQPMYGRE